MKLINIKLSRCIDLLTCEIFGQEHGFGYIKGFGKFWFDGRSMY